MTNRICSTMRVKYKSMDVISKKTGIERADLISKSVHWLKSVCGLGLFFLFGMNCANAAQIFPADGSFGFKSVFDADEIIFATGDVDRPINPFDIFPNGHVYVMPNRVWSNGDLLTDVTSDGFNEVVGFAGAGAFFDQPIWLPQPASGQLELADGSLFVGGLYDLVLDENGNGIFDFGIDAVDGAGDDYSFRVIGPTVIPLPPAVWLFGTALIGLVGFSKRRKSA